MNQKETISEFLGKKRSGVVATLKAESINEKWTLSFIPDINQLGTYSVRVHANGQSESYRMQYRGGMEVDDALAHFREYLTCESNISITIKRR